MMALDEPYGQQLDATHRAMALICAEAQNYHECIGMLGSMLQSTFESMPDTAERHEAVYRFIGVLLRQLDMEED